MDLTPELLALLADRHIVRFECMLEVGGPRVRPDECTRYLRIWKSIKRKAESGHHDDLTEEESHEVVDAISSGEADDFEPDPHMPSNADVCVDARDLCLVLEYASTAALEKHEPEGGPLAKALERLIAALEARHDGP